MPEKMNWKECTEQGIITKTVPDEERAAQTLKMANLRLEFTKMDITALTIYAWLLISEKSLRI
ncbi:hypothetical protein GF343_04770 [Candidatus Woesearchaeota archaeon]|nr:hypothetical protein [Candidatus Woesearchaeota archaeon]